MLAPSSAVAKLPAGRQLQAGDDSNARRVVPRRIEHRHFPLEIQHLARHGDAALVRLGRRHELKREVERVGAGRHIDVEREHVDRVAAPGDELTVRTDLDARQQIDRAARRMLTGVPLRVEQRQRPGRRDGDSLAHAEDAARDVAGIDVERDDPRVRYVARLGRCRRERHAARLPRRSESQKHSRCCNRCRTPKAHGLPRGKSAEHTLASPKLAKPCRRTGTRNNAGSPSLRPRPMSLTRRLTRLIETKPVSDDDLAAAAAFVLDTLANALAARHSPQGQILRDWHARRPVRHGPARVPVRRARAHPRDGRPASRIRHPSRLRGRARRLGDGRAERHRWPRLPESRARGLRSRLPHRQRRRPCALQGVAQHGHLRARTAPQWPRRGCSTCARSRPCGR